MTTKDLVMVVQSEVSVYEREANKLEIKSIGDMDMATKILSSTNKVADRVKEEKEKVTKPLNEALKAERSRWAPIENACASAIATIRGKMMEYQKKVDAENTAKQEKIMARVEKGTMKTETAVAKMGAMEDSTQSVLTDVGALQWTTVKKLVISDESLIPREYLDINTGRVRDALKNGIVIPGANLVEEKVPKNLR